MPFPGRAMLRGAFSCADLTRTRVCCAPRRRPMKIDRRDFLRGAAGASGAALFGRGWPALRAAGAPRDVSLPPPARSGIEHVIVVMMENRSFDHLLGWFPNADGRQA